MLSKVCSAAINGIETYLIEVEVNSKWDETLIVLLVSILPLRGQPGP
jgi:hypothetical protein